MKLRAALDLARQLSASESRLPVARGLGLELATQAVEYARLTRVADGLWSHWLQTRHGSTAPPPADLPIGGVLRLLAALSRTRPGAMLLRSAGLRRLAHRVIEKLEARQARSDADRGA